MSSAEYSCKLLKAIFCIPANSVDPDQTAPKGCIDGYSRCVLWLEVSSSNNNLSVKASYYLQTLKQTGRAPRLFRFHCRTKKKSSLNFTSTFSVIMTPIQWLDLEVLRLERTHQTKELNGFGLPFLPARKELVD